MAFLQVQFFSKTLNVASTVNVILPEADQGIGVKGRGSRKAPKVLYLLHGYSDDHSIWMRRTSVERYAANHNLAIIMPAVNHSFYCNEPYGERYWDYVSEELPAVMHKFFRLSDKPRDTFVAGLSMGGYGAMKLALTYPERFGAAGSFSGAVDVASMAENGSPLAKRVFPEPEKVRGAEDDLLHLLVQNADAPSKPRLLVACGTADFLYPAHQKFVPELLKHGWEVHGQDTPGATHEWGYWDALIKQFIEEFC